MSIAVLPGVCMVVMTVVVMIVVVVVSSSKSADTEDAAAGTSLSGDLLFCALDLSVSATLSGFTRVVKAGGGTVVAMATDGPRPMVTAILGVLAQGGGADVCIAVVKDSVVTSLCDAVVFPWSLITAKTLEAR